MPTQWKTEEIVKLAADLGRVSVYPGDGEYDTETVQINPKSGNEYIRICGLTEQVSVTNPKNFPVTWVEVRTDGDSAGGLQTSDEDVGAAYGRIVARLIKAGFYVVPTYDGLF